MHQLLKQNQEFWNHERSLTALLVYMCLAIICWIGLGDVHHLWWAFAITDILFNLILLAGVFAVVTRWRQQFGFIAIAFLAGLFRILSFFTIKPFALVLSHLFGVIFFVLLARMVLKHIFKDGPMNFYRIQGSIVVFLIVGIIYAMIYAMLDSVSAGAFAVTAGSKTVINDFAQFLYFSFITMTTVGIGDMVPLSPAAKALVVFQSIIGLLYPVIMIARLVSLEVNHSVGNRR
jgi:hypothetical protein